MPRLLAYLQQDPAQADTVSSQQATASNGQQFVLGSTLLRLQEVLPQQDRNPQASVDTEIDRLSALHIKRVAQHGERLYRHPDGSLQHVPPAANPYTVANRRRWHVLATYCRTVGQADQDVRRAGVSARHGVGLTYQQYERALQSIGLKPEYDINCNWNGWHSDEQDPLQDPNHLFNSQNAYAALATAVFREVAQRKQGGVASQQH